jgi:ABC-2 type transport system ATP-binding protein
MIEIKNVSKKFKNETILKDLSVSFEKGKITGIVGNNGSGKTVLFKIICGLMSPSTGKVIVDDKVIGKDVDFPENLGMIIETPGFSNWQSGFSNLYDLARYRRKIGKDKIIEVMNLVGLEPKSKKPVGKYSLGMRQRLGIAQAIMEDQTLLVLDEPMNGLDKHGIEDMRKVFLSLKENGKTILIASHNKEDIEILCDDVYEMDAGILSKINS